MQILRRQPLERKDLTPSSFMLLTEGPILGVDDMYFDVG